MSCRCSVFIVSLFLVFQLVLSGPALSPMVSGEEDCCGAANRIAVLETDYGVIRFVLYENLTPISTENFISLAEKGHYDGVVFHRIVKDFVIQTGDGGGGSTIPLEIHPNATHVDGAIGMARSSEPDSASDQFYICDGPQHGLDGDYAVFGVVIEGIDVVRQIADVPVYGENDPRPGFAPSLWYNMGMPKEDVYIQRAYIETHGLNETQTGDSYLDASSHSNTVWLLMILVPAILGVVYLKRKDLGKLGL